MTIVNWNPMKSIGIEILIWQSASVTSNKTHNKRQRKNGSNTYRIVIFFGDYLSVTFDFPLGECEGKERVDPSTPLRPGGPSGSRQAAGQLFTIFCSQRNIYSQ